ncbi:MAG: response regulator transcription factor [Salinisphaera sp.]|nr:response regulator transcription factor [Salinisphaera sp.]
MTQTRVYLIDDHHVLRQAVARMLDDEADITVVGQAGDVATGLAELAALPVYPHVVMLDLKLPGRSGMSAIAEILKLQPHSRIIIFTMYDNPGYVWATMNAGACAYLLKSASSRDLLAAVRSVAAGGGYLQAEVTMPLLKRLVQEARSARDASELTVREMQILEALAEGQSNKQIARTLELAEETVKSHLKKVYEKLGASDRAHAVAIALRQELIE